MTRKRCSELSFEFFYERALADPSRVQNFSHILNGLGRNMWMKQDKIAGLVLHYGKFIHRFFEHVDPL
jgi:hypothetical protein